MKTPRAPKDTEKVWITVGIALIILVFFVGIYGYYQASSGRAVFFGEQPLLTEPVNLIEEGSLIFTSLPEEGETKSARITTALEPYGTTTYIDDVNISGLEGGAYSIRVGGLSDLLREGDVIPWHLDIDDATPDLEISFTNGQIIVRNMHYILPNAAEITLYKVNASGDTREPYPPIIRLAPSTTFTARINATSNSPPQLSASIGQLSNQVPMPEHNATTANLIHSVPGESTAQILTITAQVQSQRSRAYYVLAIGDVAYAQLLTIYPQMMLRITSENDGVIKGKLSVTFNHNTKLQPFSLPCDLNEPVADSFFNNSPVQRVYRYDASDAEAEIWTADAAPNEFDELSPFDGYFVQLQDVEEGANTTVEAECTIPTLRPASTVPSLTPATTRLLRTGWNLISLNGVVPQPLSDFTATDDFRLFTCREDNICSEIAVDAPLNPGLPYWVFTTHQTTIAYYLD